MRELSRTLEIYIITYNRADALMDTVESLLSSPFSSCSITVLDNCSTDDTAYRVLQLAEQHPQLRHVRNVANIGAGANAIQPFLMSRAPYVWVVCDDDYLDFTDYEDVRAALDAAAASLIIVGGHEEPVRDGGGSSAGPRSLMSEGLNYFRDTSFLPSTIYSTVFARDFLAECYAFCSFHYPHVAILLGAHRSDALCYVSRSRLVTPSIGTQSYSQTAQMQWWFGLAGTIPDREVRRQFLKSQFVGLLDRTGLYGLVNTLVRMRLWSRVAETLLLFHVRIVPALARMIGARLRGVRYR